VSYRKRAKSESPRKTRDSSGACQSPLGSGGPPQFHHDFAPAILPAAMESGNSRNIRGHSRNTRGFSASSRSVPCDRRARTRRQRGRRIREFAGNFLKTRRQSSSQRAARAIQRHPWTSDCGFAPAFSSALRVPNYGRQRIARNSAGTPSFGSAPASSSSATGQVVAIQRMVQRFVPLARAPDESKQFEACMIAALGGMIDRIIIVGIAPRPAGAGRFSG